MRDEYQNVTLSTLQGGAAEELFQCALEEVLANISSPDTDAEAVRQITLTVRVKPSTERDVAAVTIQAKTKLAPTIKVGTSWFMGHHRGRMVAVENNPKQMQLQWDEESKPTAISEGAER